MLIGMLLQHELDHPGIVKLHDDVIKWKHFPRYWPFVGGIHRSQVNSLHKVQWRGALFSFICVWINDWVNNGEAGDLRRYRAHYDFTVISILTHRSMFWQYLNLDSNVTESAPTWQKSAVEVLYFHSNIFLVIFCGSPLAMFRLGWKGAKALPVSMMT